MRCTVTSPSIKYFQYFGFLGLVTGTSAFTLCTLQSILFVIMAKLFTYTA